MGVDKTSVYNWEKNRTQPALWQIPRILEFLGNDPFGEGGPLGERLKQYRKAHGITQKDLARQLGVDPGTLGRWENGRRPCDESRQRELIAFLDKHDKKWSFG